MIIKLITIQVKNMEESLSFYQDKLGFVEVRRIDHIKGMTMIFMKDQGDGIIELIENTNISSDNNCIGESIVSFAMSVDDIKNTINELKKNGVTIEKEPISTPSGEIIAFIKDPNGVEIEFIEGFKI